ncbi:MAG: DUF1573 domain-containing protein [Pirellulaceae bacterium]
MQTALFLLVALGADLALQSSDTRIGAQVCGSNSLTLAASYLSGTPADEVHALLDPARAPFSLADLDRAARQVGLQTAVLRWNDKRQARFDCPAVLHVRAKHASTACDHFITCFGEQGDYLCVADFPGAPKLVSRDWVFRFWEGDALYLDAPGGTRIDAVQQGNGFAFAIWIVAAVAGGGLILLAGPLLARRMPRLSASRQWTWTAALVAAGAGIAALVVWMPRTNDDAPGLLAVEPLLTVRGDPDQPGERAQVVFRLRNASRRSVTIGDVSTTCSCLVPAGIQGKSIAPGEEWPLEVRVGVPELGESAQQLLVFHDGPASPLALSVKAQGRRQLPVLDVVENKYPLFDDLVDASATQTIVVKTIEQIGSAPWLGELSPAHASVKITREDVSEEVDPRAGFVRRTYRYAVGWNDIPAQSELRSPIYAKTAIDPEPGLFIGSVAAQVEPSFFSPALVHLQRGKADEEWVLFQGSPDASQPWIIPDKAQLPAWLAAEWDERDGQRALRISLAPAFDSPQPERFHLPLLNASGQADSLEVVAYPES